MTYRRLLCSWLLLLPFCIGSFCETVNSVALALASAETCSLRHASESSVQLSQKKARLLTGKDSHGEGQIASNVRSTKRKIEKYFRELDYNGIREEGGDGAKQPATTHLASSHAILCARSCGAWMSHRVAL